MKTQVPVFFDVSVDDTRFDWVMEAKNQLKGEHFETVEELPKGKPGFVISAYPEALSLASKHSSLLVPIGVFNHTDETKILDDAGAWFLTDQKEELVLFVTQEKIQNSLSVVLLAYNEEGAIQNAILDAERFCARYTNDFEIVVVNDGSQDQTESKIRELKNPKVKLVVHEKNKGMGGSLRSGFLAATKNLIAPLPGDRQVRAFSLIHFLSKVSKTNSVVSTYRGLPSGKQRGILSIVFRTLLKVLGGLEINFAGSYMFHRDWIQKINPQTIHYESYLFSFEILRRLKKEGSTFSHVFVRPFPRFTGASTEYQLKRILYVVWEMISVRLGYRHGE